MKTGEASASCKVPKRFIKAPISILRSKNSKECKPNSVTSFVSDEILKFLRDDKYNPVSIPDPWFLKVLDSRVKADVLRIWGLKDSQVELCQYKSHGSGTQKQVGIKVKIANVTAKVNVQ